MHHNRSLLPNVEVLLGVMVKTSTCSNKLLDTEINFYLSVIPDRVHFHSWSFFDGPDSSTKFHWKRSKIKGTYTSEVGMAQNGEKQGWALKKDPLLENEFFWGGGSNGKVVAPGILVMCPADKNRDYHTKKWLFAPNIQIVGQKSTFSPLATNWSLTNQCFNTKKGVSLVSWYEGAKSFTLSPQKNWFFGPKTDKFGP